MFSIILKGIVGLFTRAITPGCSVLASVQSTTPSCSHLEVALLRDARHPRDPVARLLQDCTRPPSCPSGSPRAREPSPTVWAGSSASRGGSSPELPPRPRICGSVNERMMEGRRPSRAAQSAAAASAAAESQSRHEYLWRCCGRASKSSSSTSVAAPARRAPSPRSRGGASGVPRANLACARDPARRWLAVPFERVREYLTGCRRAADRDGSERWQWYGGRRASSTTTVPASTSRTRAARSRPRSADSTCAFVMSRPSSRSQNSPSEWRAPRPRPRQGPPASPPRPLRCAPRRARRRARRRATRAPRWPSTARATRASGGSISSTTATATTPSRRHFAARARARAPRPQSASAAASALRARPNRPQSASATRAAPAPLAPRRRRGRGGLAAPAREVTLTAPAPAAKRPRPSARGADGARRRARSACGAARADGQHALRRGRAPRPRPTTRPRRGRARKRRPRPLRAECGAAERRAHRCGDAGRGRTIRASRGRRRRGRFALRGRGALETTTISESDLEEARRVGREAAAAVRRAAAARAGPPPSSPAPPPTPVAAFSPTPQPAHGAAAAAGLPPSRARAAPAPPRATQVLFDGALDPDLPASAPPPLAPLAPARTSLWADDGGARARSRRARALDAAHAEAALPPRSARARVRRAPTRFTSCARPTRRRKRRATQPRLRGTLDTRWAKEAWPLRPLRRGATRSGAPSRGARAGAREWATTPASRRRQSRASRTTTSGLRRSRPRARSSPSRGPSIARRAPRATGSRRGRVPPSRRPRWSGDLSSGVRGACWFTGTL